MTFAVASPKNNLNLSEKSNNQTNRLSYRTNTGRKEFNMSITENEHNIILNNMESLLEEYDYNYTTKALNTIIDEWANQKQELIAAFKRHPNYLEGEFCIAFSADYERTITKEPSANFSTWLLDTLYSIEIPQEIKEVKEGNELIPWSMHNVLERMLNVQSPKELLKFSAKHSHPFTFTLVKRLHE